MAKREWILKRNCSISPGQLARAYTALCVASLLIGSYFAARGAWLVPVFSVLELMAVAIAFVSFGRHVGDREHVALSDSGLLVELVQAECVSQYRMDPRRTRVAMPAVRHGLISLESNGARIEVGRFLTESKRREFARELNEALAGYRASLGNWQQHKKFNRFQSGI